MSNIPISSLPLAIALDGSEFVPIVQGGTTKRTTLDDIIALTGNIFPFLGPTQYITTAGTHAIAADIAVVIVAKSIQSDTPLVLSSLASRNGLPLHVSDITGFGGDITFTPDGIETFMRLPTWIISSGGAAGTGASITWYPNVPTATWYL